MHRALSIENLSYLPGRYRLMATSAANGSLRDLTRVYSYLDILGEANGRFLLPIFHRSLDPAGIPNAAALDTLSTSSSDDCCERAAMALNCIVHLTRNQTVLSPELMAEFWPRMWVWIKFLHKYRDSVPVMLAADPVATYSTYGSIIAHFALDLIDTTPGLKAVITAAWKVLLGVNGEFQEWTYRLLCQLIESVGMSLEPVGRSQPGTHLAELVEGAGGTLHDLTSLLVLHIRCAVWTPQSRVSAQTLNGMLFSGTKVIGGISDKGPVDAALLSGGVVNATIRGLCSLMHSGLPIQSADTTLCFVFHHLLYFLSIPPGYPTVRRALKAGLLRLILDSSRQSQTVSIYLGRLLKGHISPATVYHSVLLELQKSLADVAELEGLLAFQGSRIFPEWSKFADLAHVRIRLMNEYNAGMHISRKVCSNIDCRLVKPKTQFLRCSACEGGYYCFVDCQSADWAAGHQQSCRELSLARLRLFGTRSKRDTSFLRALVHSDYNRSRGAILLQHMFDGRVNPPTFSTVWLDYSTSAGLLLTAPQPPFPPATTPGEEENERHINRGNMQNHHVVLAEGSAKADLIFQMHIRDPRVRDELRRISNNLPEGGHADVLSLEPATRDEITALLEIEVEEIH
ncbi:hypothetical protein B0H16DRAFT_1804413 [Mycena metata]|uniref:MYND-type domain-containing protein n=1 Tax=Mycena metata TaxID=1033252 RepID=A0AAD7JER7_9AGAR|nr:hypothetical protein B0H16DRAFT_1804413 [Mycena metata]